MFLTIIIFIIILGILVFVHEFGHFFVAKRSGMKVEEFGFGFPPRVVGIQKINGEWKMRWGNRRSAENDSGSTVYSINAIPLGGFVRILGENNESENDPRSFVNRPFWGRFLTLVAGVAMNWVLAAVILSFVAMAGTNSELTPDLPSNAIISNRQVIIGEVLANSPAEKAGLQNQDFIISIDGKKFETTEAARNYIIANEGKVFNFEVQRINVIKTLQVQSRANPGPNEGPVGIGLSDIATVKLPFFSAVKQGISETYYITGAIFAQLGGLFKTKGAFNQIGGPVAIGRLVGQVRQLGIIPLLRLMALLSLSLAVLNIMPFPALDGGRVLFLFIEKIRGKKNNQRVEQFFNTAGFVFLLLLMVVVTIKDIVKK